MPGNPDQDEEAGREEQENQPEDRLDDDRESIWTIPAKLKRWYFGLFSIQAVIAAIWLSRTAILDESRNGAEEILTFLWLNMAPAAVTSATFALLIIDTVNGIMVLSTWLEDELKKRRRRQIKAAVDKALKETVPIAVKEAVEEAVDKTLKEAVPKAVKEARAEERRKWQGWNSRREAAAAAGEAFNEPHPGADAENEDSQPREQG